MNKPTDYTESNALLAVIAENDDEAERILSEMTYGELRNLESAAFTFERLVKRAIRNLSSKDKP